MDNTIYHGAYDATGEKEAFHDMLVSLLVGFITISALIYWGVNHVRII